MKAPNRDKLTCVRKLLASNAFVLVTDTEAMMYVDLEKLSAIQQLHVLKQTQTNLSQSIKQFEKLLKEKKRIKRKGVK